MRNNATSCGEQSPEHGPAGMESRSSKQTGERGSTWRWSVIWSYLLALGISFMPFAIGNGWPSAGDDLILLIILTFLWILFATECVVQHYPRGLWALAGLPFVVLSWLWLFELDAADIQHLNKRVNKRAPSLRGLLHQKASFCEAVPGQNIFIPAA